MIIMGGSSGNNLPKYGSTYQIPLKSTAPKVGITSTYQIPRVTPAVMPKTTPLNKAADTGEINRFNNIQKGINVGSALGATKPTSFSGASGNAPVTTTVSGGGGGGGINVSSLFGPLFDALRQQRKLAESRYAANSGQIQNLYGQLIGARSADVDDIDEAYKRLQQAAASRGEATIGKMEAREATRLSQNEAVLQSMGVAGIGSSVGDIASQSAGVAQDVELMNQSNWAGMLDAMGKTSQEIARADVTSYGYAQMEDIAQLQAAKEDYLQNLAQQEFELKFQEQQAKLQAQQAAAANAARVQAAQIRAQQSAAEAASKQQGAALGNFLKNADPITRIIVSATQAQMPVNAGKLTNAYDSFLANMGNPPRGQLQWDANSAANAFATSPAATGLTQLEKRLIQEAIRDSF